MWKSLFIPDDILKAVEDLGFQEPTPIQQEVLPLAIRDYADILGSAPTGSGKTLAFGIPLLCRMREAKLRLAENVETTHISPLKEDQILQSLSTPKKNGKRQGKPSRSGAGVGLIAHKRRKVMGELGLIEELDPHTMNVLRVHDLPNKSAVVPSDEPSASVEHPIGGVLGLVILPTRELALQVTTHLRSLAKHMNSPGVTIEAIVGGMSIQKQERCLRQRHPDVVVATPGRLWEFIQQGNNHIISMPKTLVSVVFDEADRLVESQHYLELESILVFLKKKPDSLKRQTFVFSATLAFVHKNALMPGTRSKRSARELASERKFNVNAKLGFLRDMLGLSPRAKVVNFSTTPSESMNKPEQVPCGRLEAAQKRTFLPPGLSEFRLTCPNQMEKDVLLVWLLLVARVKSSGRALVFLNSKSGTRRLAGVLRQCVVLSPHLCILHADMIQKQRLRSLERFQASKSAVMLATDVAARGLDFAACEVAWVVHFDVPHTAEIYVHRCGRTARANRSGRSVVMLTPSDIVRWRKLVQSLHLHPSDGPISDLPEVRPSATTEEISEFRSIVELMRKLDKIQHGESKKAADRDWFRRVAREADIDLDSELDRSSDESESGGPRSRGRKTVTKKAHSLRQELDALLALRQRRLDRKTKLTQQAFYGLEKCASARESRLTSVG